MNEKIKDLFLILLVGAVIIAGYYFYQNNFGMSGLESDDVNVEIIQGDEENVISDETADSQSTSPKTTTTKTYAPPAQSAPTITKEGIYLVYLYKSGFYPNYLRVRRGTSVRFINKVDSSMRIYALDQSTGIQRQLNQSKTVGYDGTYDYSFTETGVWIYTNYTDQSKIGTVEVF